MSSSTTDFVIFLTLAILFTFANAQNERYDYPRANLSTTWVNAPGRRGSVDYSTPNLTVRAVLLNSRQGIGTRYACGFYRNGTNRYMLAVVMVQVNSGAGIVTPTGQPPAVWSANRNNLVGENSTLSLTSQGNLILNDEHGSLVWSTNTTGQNVVAMEMLETGNLVLVNEKEEIVWQSFDHPTDTLVLGQTLKNGMRLTSSRSAQNPEQGDFVLEMRNTTLSAMIVQGSTAPQKYWALQSNRVPDISPYAVFTNGSILLFTRNATVQSSSSSDASQTFPTSPTQYQFLQLNPNGALKIYQSGTMGKEEIGILLKDRPCQLPTNCGSYGLCTRTGSCSCSYASADALTQAEERASEAGCRLVTPLASCNDTSSVNEHYFVNVSQVDYFALDFVPRFKVSTDECQQLCSTNCTCKAVFIVQEQECYMLDQVYTLREVWRYQDVPERSSFALIKVQRPLQQSIPQDASNRSFWSRNARFLIPTISTVVVVSIAMSIRRKLKHRRRLKVLKEELLLDAMPGLPRRFTHEELSVATKDFSNKLGEGGFGSVFFGVLPEDTKIAVKRLESTNQGQKEFRTEVVTIGSIHHFHLVRLHGFCAEGEHRLLVYEHVANGSLDKWLFPKTEAVLDWGLRLRIALGTARGLAYLHEECRERIIHLDVKPQNILLDERFNAKVCDFGMSKLMERDESCVFTTMRGTRGYLAPEWLQSSITEKVDVYSFGIVLLELLSGEKCLDMGRLESSKRYMASWALERVGSGEMLLEDMIDVGIRNQAENDQSVREQMERVLEIAICCIQEEPTSRPSMSKIVQMLEGYVAKEREDTLEGFHSGALSQHYDSKDYNDEEGTLKPPSSFNSV